MFYLSQTAVNFVFWAAEFHYTGTERRRQGSSPSGLVGLLLPLLVYVVGSETHLKEREAAAGRHSALRRLNLKKFCFT